MRNEGVASEQGEDEVVPVRTESAADRERMNAAVWEASEAEWAVERSAEPASSQAAETDPIDWSEGSILSVLDSSIDSADALLDRNAAEQEPEAELALWAPTEAQQNDELSLSELSPEASERDSTVEVDEAAIKRVKSHEPSVQAVAEADDTVQTEPEGAGVETTIPAEHQSEVDADEARQLIEQAYRMGPERRPVYDRDERIPDGDRSDIRQRIDNSEALNIHNTSELERYAEDNLGIGKVELGRFDERTAQEVVATLEAFTDRYPEVQGLRYLGTTQERNDGIRTEPSDLAGDIESSDPSVLAAPSDGTYAAALRGAGEFNGISLNEAWANNYADLSDELRGDYLRGESSTVNVAGALAHEFGHLVHYEIENSPDKASLNSKLDRYLAQDIEELTDALGSYAAKNRFELFAEAFADLHMSPVPSQISLEIGAIVDKWRSNNIL